MVSIIVHTHIYVSVCIGTTNHYPLHCTDREGCGSKKRKSRGTRKDGVYLTLDTLEAVCKTIIAKVYIILCASH